MKRITLDYQSVRLRRFAVNEVIASNDLQTINEAVEHRHMNSGARTGAVWVPAWRTLSATFATEGLFAETRNLDAHQLTLVPTRELYDAYTEDTINETGWRCLHVAIRGTDLELEAKIVRVRQGLEVVVGTYTLECGAGDPNLAHGYALVEVDNFEPLAEALQLRLRGKSIGVATRLFEVSFAETEHTHFSTRSQNIKIHGSDWAARGETGTAISAWDSDGFAGFSDADPALWGLRRDEVATYVDAVLSNGVSKMTCPAVRFNTSWISFACAIRVNNTGGTYTRDVLYSANEVVTAKFSSGTFTFTFKDDFTTVHSVSCVWPTDDVYHDLLVNYDQDDVIIYIDGVEGARVTIGGVTIENGAGEDFWIGGNDMEATPSGEIRLASLFLLDRGFDRLETGRVLASRRAQLGLATYANWIAV